MIQEADENFEKDATLVEGSTFLNKLTLGSKQANYDLPSAESLTKQPDDFVFEVANGSGEHERTPQ
jgi:hypothetical protein